MRPHVRRHFVGCLTASALLATPGCMAAPPEPDRTVVSTGPDGLVQRVTFSPRTVPRGDTLYITSTVVNTGNQPAQVTAQVCGLGVTAPSPVLQEDNGVRCVAFSVPVRLAPGDSTRGSDHRLVIGAPGRYQLRVRHLLQPELAATGEILVR